MNNPIGIRFSAEERAAIDAAAEGSGLSRHALMRIAILTLIGYSALPTYLANIFKPTKEDL